MGKFKTRRLESFGPIFFKLTKVALLGIKKGTIGSGALFKFDAGSPGGAINMSMQIRQYWQCVTAASERGEISAFDPLTPLLPQIPYLAVRVNKKSSIVEVIHRDQLASHKVLATALGALDAALTGFDVPLDFQLPATNEMVESVTKALKPGDSQEDLLAKTYGIGGQNEKKE